MKYAENININGLAILIPNINAPMRVTVVSKTAITRNINNLPKYISEGVYLVPVDWPVLSITQVIIAPTHIDKTI